MLYKEIQKQDTPLNYVFQMQIRYYDAANNNKLMKTTATVYNRKFLLDSYEIPILRSLTGNLLFIFFLSICSFSKKYNTLEIPNEKLKKSISLSIFFQDICHKQELL